MRRLAIMSVLAVALAGALVVAPSQAKPAQAGVSFGPKVVYQEAVRVYGFQYNISVDAACVQQHGAGAFARYWSYTNPYSWGCYRVISWWPYRLQYLGGLDLNRYCRENTPSPVARVTAPSKGVLGWSCVPSGEPA
jgi:hypothetical protein